MYNEEKLVEIMTKMAGTIGIQAKNIERQTKIIENLEKTIGQYTIDKNTNSLKWDWPPNGIYQQCTDPNCNVGYDCTGIMSEDNHPHYTKGYTGICEM